VEVEIGFGGEVLKPPLDAEGRGLRACRATVTRKATRFPRFDSHDDLLDAPVHDLSAAEAEHTVRRVVENWHRRGGGVLHLITGKGKVAALLRRDLSAYVADHAADTAGGGFKVRVR
jgi:hypothetical protein